jgi:hypothetical protein
MLPHMKAMVIFIEKKQKTTFFEKPNNQQPKTKQTKNMSFAAPPILNIFLQKFKGLILG